MMKKSFMTKSLVTTSLVTKLLNSQLGKRTAASLTRGMRRSMMMAKAQLVDASGKPVKSQSLEKEFAGVLGKVRSPFSDHPADGLTPTKLSQLLNDAAEGDVEAYFDLAEDMEERDLHYLAVLSTRKRQVAQLAMTVEAASDEKSHIEHADFIRDWLDKDILRSSLVDILDAIGKGISVCELIWQPRDNFWTIANIVHRPQRWFKPIREDGETLILRGENNAEIELPPHQFLVHRHPSKSGLTVRSGLARIAAWAYMYKSYTLKDWAIFVQNYAMPIRTGRYDNSATEEDKAVLWRAVKNVAGDMAAIFPNTMEINFEEVAAKGTGIDLYERRADWMDRQISKAVLGQTTTTDAVSGGHAVAQEHRLVQEDIERSDAAILGATINRQLIPNLIAFNFGVQDHYPKIRIGRPDEMDIGRVADTIAKTGLTVEASWLRDRIGAPDPEEGAELVGGRMGGIQGLFGRASNGDGSSRLSGEGTTDRPALFSYPSNGASSQSRDNRQRLRAQSSLHHRFHREATDAVMEKLQERLEDDTAAALLGLSDEIREIFETAETLEEIADRLEALKLDPSELSKVMARGLALSHLAGQAALIDEIF